MNGACVKWWNLLLLMAVAACALSGRDARATAPARRDQISLNGAWDGGDVPQYQGFTLAGNARKTFSRRVTIEVPEGAGKELTLLLRVRKDGRLRFEEPRRFKIMP